MSQYEPLYDSFSHGGRGGYVPTPRMSVSSSVYLPGSDVDPQTGWLKPDRQRRCRTQGKQLEMERLTREQQALEVVLGISLATLCNFANSLAQSPVNPQLQPYLPEQFRQPQENAHAG